MTQKKKRGGKTVLGRDAWLATARSALIKEGIGGVEIGKLARKLRVTRGGFYWFFASRKQFLDCVLADWEQTNTAAFHAVVQEKGVSGLTEFDAVVDIWLKEDRYSPQWDAAVREWARIAPHVAKVVRRVDEVRIGIFQRIFRDMGYAEQEAFVRARITYFHQVGYYALGLEESAQQRRALAPLYVQVLVGRDP
jgi:AcrR family transcriptional regulator